VINRGLQIHRWIAYKRRFAYVCFQGLSNAVAVADDLLDITSSKVSPTNSKLINVSERNITSSGANSSRSLPLWLYADYMRMAVATWPVKMRIPAKCFV